MLGYFKNNELRKIDVLGNGETVYALKDESERLQVLTPLVVRNAY